MSRNNTVSVIEVASEASNNQSNRSNSPFNEPDDEIWRTLVSISNDVQQVNSLFMSTTRDEKPSKCGQFSRESTLLHDKVEFKQKMRRILCCRICSELRRCPIYQCKYGHLICAGCLNDILSESRLKNEIASCPECQTTITKELCFRNVAVEKTISELPITCTYCSKELPPSDYPEHVNSSCGKRPTTCTNVIIGCPWQGPEKERIAHERQCSQLKANGYEILKSLEKMDQKQTAGHDIYNKIMDLMSVEKISYTELVSILRDLIEYKRKKKPGSFFREQNKKRMHEADRSSSFMKNWHEKYNDEINLQLKLVKTENNKNIIFETSKFSAFENQWIIRAYCHSDVNKNICYQLAVKSKLISPMTLKYLILNGPYNDMDIKPNIDQFKFSEKTEESPYQNLEVPNPIHKEIFYSAKRINIRIFMFIIGR